jgi:DNA polymerase-3 subunit epsilon
MLQVAEVRVDRCATELEAEDRELRLIGVHQPPYNRSGRRPARPAWLR